MRTALQQNDLSFPSTANQRLRWPPFPCIPCTHGSASITGPQTSITTHTRPPSLYKPIPLFPSTTPPKANPRKIIFHITPSPLQPLSIFKPRPAHLPWQTHLMPALVPSIQSFPILAFPTELRLQIYACAFSLDPRFPIPLAVVSRQVRAEAVSLFSVSAGTTAWFGITMRKNRRKERGTRPEDTDADLDG